MKLSTQAIIRLDAALQSLDVPGKSDLIAGATAAFAQNMGNGLDNAVRAALDFAIDKKQTPHKFAGSVRMAIAKNLARLGQEILAYQKARNQLVYDHAEPGANTVKPDKLADFEKAHNELLASEQDVDLIRLTEPLLQLDVNDIPVSVLAALMPIMKDTDSAGDLPEAKPAVASSAPALANGAAPPSA